MERREFGVREFDLVVVNNSLCYVARSQARAAPRSSAWRGALRPGGWLVMRNPNRLFPLDQFTGIPLLGLLPAARRGARSRALLGRRRSDVRLTVDAGARGASSPRPASPTSASPSPRAGALDRLLVPIARYQHVVARSPEEARDA